MIADNLKKLNTSHYRWIVLSISTLTQTTSALVVQGIPTMAFFFQQEFSLSKSQLGVVVATMNIGAIFTLAYAGNAVDKYGERKVILVGGSIIGLLSMSLVYAGSFPVLLTLMFLMGIGYATTTPGGSKAIMNWFPVQQRGMAMGVRQMGIPLGGTLAALTLPSMAIHIGWRHSMLFAGIVSIIGAAVFYSFYMEYSSKKEEADNLKHNKIVIRRFDLFKNPSFLCTSLLSLVLVISQFSLVTYLILFLTEKLRYPLVLASFLLAVTQLSGAFGRIFFGIISDRVFKGSRKKVLFLITVTVAISSLLFSVLTESLPYFLIFAVVVIMGSVSIGWNGLFITLISELVDEGFSGMAVGLSMTITQIGIILGPPLFGLIVDISNSYSTAWLLLSGLVWLSLFLFQYIKEPKMTG